MKLRLAGCVAAAGLLLVSGTAWAQGEQAAPVEAVDSDLRCAIWAAVVGGGAVGEEKAALDAVFTFFMGRFEGRTGQSIEAAMTAELITRQTEVFAAEIAFCEPRALELADRLIVFGEELQTAAANIGELQTD